MAYFFICTVFFDYEFMFLGTFLLIFLRFSLRVFYSREDRSCIAATWESFTKQENGRQAALLIRGNNFYIIVLKIEETVHFLLFVLLVI